MRALALVAATSLPDHARALDSEFIMATTSTSKKLPDSYYPDSDGQPMGETPRHRKNMTNTIETLEVWFEDDPWVYVSGNMFIYYVPGDRLRHVSPDVFVVRGVPKLPERRRYLVWEERKGPDLAIEMTSPSTREEDLEDKFFLYQDTLRIQEYFLFDPYTEYLQPPLQGYRLHRGGYVRIRPVQGRLPSKVLGLHLEQDDGQLRLYNPATGQWLPTPQEEREARRRAEAAQKRAEAEVERLRRELERLRKGPKS
jgi:Uma2 family endonuclease